MAEPVKLSINGTVLTIKAKAETPLLDVLRNELHLMASRFGCGVESCGACMVLVDGAPTYACTVAIDALAGKTITTLEGLGNAGRPHAVQQAFLELQAGQCGYCLSGIMISSKALLERNPKPSRSEIAAALDKHLCRCGAHARILCAVQRAAELLAEAGGRA